MVKADGSRTGHARESAGRRSDRVRSPGGLGRRDPWQSDSTDGPGRSRTTRPRTLVVIVRFADDFIVGFEQQDDAKQFLHDLRQRFVKFGLELHPDKTRLIEFGRHAAERRVARGLGKPETFDFLGFTHICAKTRAGRFKLTRITSSKRMRAKLAPGQGPDQAASA